MFTNVTAPATFSRTIRAASWLGLLHAGSGHRHDALLQRIRQVRPRRHQLGQIGPFLIQKRQETRQVLRLDFVTGAGVDA
jgi:hypothetical protein